MWWWFFHARLLSRSHPLPTRFEFERSLVEHSLDTLSLDTLSLSLDTLDTLDTRYSRYSRSRTHSLAGFFVLVEHSLDTLSLSILSLSRYSRCSRSRTHSLAGCFVCDLCDVVSLSCVHVCVPWAWASMGNCLCSVSLFVFLFFCAGGLARFFVRLVGWVRVVVLLAVCCVCGSRRRESVTSIVCVGSFYCVFSVRLPGVWGSNVLS